MKYSVIKPFKDKYTKKLYNTGDEYEPESQMRADYLAEAGVIELVGQPIPEVAVIPLGGGWFQLPDGRKVRKSELEGGETQ